ncbi:MAG: cadherin-like beta sandwich domain-containing protein [Bacilli bacterium]
MKKILLGIIALLSFMLLPQVVFASSMGVGLTGTQKIDAGSQFTINITASSNEGVYGLLGTIDYDHSKLTLLTAEGMNGFNATMGKNLVLDAAKPVTNGVVATITFKASSNFVVGTSTTITFKNISGVVGSNATDVSSGNASINISVNVPKSGENNLADLRINGTTINGFKRDTIYYVLSRTDSASLSIEALTVDNKASVSGTGAKQLRYGKNSFVITVSAENGATKNYTIVITRNDSRSNNNYLKSLTIENHKLDFNKDTVLYSLTVNNDVTSITIGGSSEDNKANINGLQAYSLNEGLNSIHITVTAENGETRVYQVNVIRKPSGTTVLSDNNNLKEIVINGKTINTTSSTFGYLVTFDETVVTPIITAVLEDNKAVYSVVKPYSLKVGSNTVLINVTSESGKVRTYTLYVVRQDSYPSYGDPVDASIYHINLNKVELTEQLLTELKNKDKTYYLDYYDNMGNILYTLKIKSKDLPATNQSLIELVKVETGYKQLHNKNVLSYYLNTKLNNYSLYVGDRFQNTDKVYLYFYQDGKLSKPQTINITNGYIELTKGQIGSYLLTTEKVKLNISLSSLLNIILILITLALIISYIKNKQNKAKNNDKPSLQNKPLVEKQIVIPAKKAKADKTLEKKKAKADKALEKKKAKDLKAQLKKKAKDLALKELETTKKAKAKAKVKTKANSIKIKPIIDVKAETKRINKEKKARESNPTKSVEPVITKKTSSTKTNTIPTRNIKTKKSN